LWYYTPMFLGFTSHLASRLVVYDCMDELSAFKGAAPEMKAKEAELLRRAELVFTGGQSLYEAKKETHPKVYCLPSSIDFKHFSQARTWKSEPVDQQSIPSPRLGYFGVIDERMDLELLAALAVAHPEWQLVMVGPVVKIDPASLPRRDNIHYLGMKSYKELPAYLAGWDVALLPFALNESTRFISPTKTPEYLAGGRPVVSTPITDVVRPYGERGLIRVGSTPEEFIAEVEASLQASAHYAAWLRQVDKFLHNNSWDNTWNRMYKLIDEAQRAKLPMRGIRRASRRNRLGALTPGEVGRATNDQPLPIS
jgi:UDP-galactopyranose mutase